MGLVAPIRGCCYRNTSRAARIKLFLLRFLLEENEVGSRGKAPGRHPQMPKYSYWSKAQERVNFRHRRKEGEPSPGVLPSTQHILKEEPHNAYLRRCVVLLVCCTSLTIPQSATLTAPFTQGSHWVCPPKRRFCRTWKPPLCKGRWHGVPEGLYGERRAWECAPFGVLCKPDNPSVSLR